MTALDAAAVALTATNLALTAILIAYLWREHRRWAFKRRVAALRYRLFGHIAEGGPAGQRQGQWDQPPL